MKMILHFLLFLWSIGTNMIRKIFPAYLAGFVPSAFHIGLVNTGYEIGKSLSLPCGFAADKMGKVRAIMISFILISITAVLVSLTFEVLHFVVLFVIIGVVSNFFYTSLLALISFQRRKTESLFRMESFYQFGFFLGPILGGLIVSFYSMTLALYTWAVLGIIGFVVSIFLSKMEVVKEEIKGFSGFFHQIKRGKSRFFVILLVGTIFTGFFFSSINLVIPLYMVGLGMDIYHVGLVFGFGAIASSVGFYLLGKRFERFSKEKALVIIMLLTSFAFFAMNYAYEIITLSLIFALFAIGRGGGLNITRAFISENTSQEMRSTGMAFVDTLHFGGGILGPVSAGLLIDLVSIQSVFFLLLGISILGVLIVLIYSIWRR
ncbi:MAG: MFS transporter [Candidatus Aenigmarchaeota archaeon]